MTRSGELIQMFTGGDPGIAASLKRMYEQEGPQRASRGLADPEDLAYLENASRYPVVIPSAGQSACSDTASSRIARRHCGGASSHE